MSFTVTLTRNGGNSTLLLTGSLDSQAAPRLRDAIERATATPVERLVLDMEELSYLSSAGLRCLLYAQQRITDGARLVVAGAAPGVLESIRMTGLDQSLELTASVRE